MFGCKSKPKQLEEVFDVQEIIRSYNIPNPPLQYCRECGNKLGFEFVEAKRHYFGKYDKKTGKEWFIVYAKYICPIDNKHFTMSNKIVYWTDGDRWYWNTAFTLTLI